MHVCACADTTAATTTTTFFTARLHAIALYSALVCLPVRQKQLDVLLKQLKLSITQTTPHASPHAHTHNSFVIPTNSQHAAIRFLTSKF